MRPEQNAPDNVEARIGLHEDEAASMRPEQNAPDNFSLLPGSRLAYMLQ